MLCAVVLVIAACRGNDERTEQLERQLEAQERELAELRARLAGIAAGGSGPGMPVDAAPLAAPPLPDGDVSADCRRYLATLTAYLGCRDAPLVVREAASEKAVDFMKTWADATTPEQRREVTQRCGDRRTELAKDARALGCVDEALERVP
jgi:hypothetical protein